MADDDIMTIREVAGYLRIAEQTAYRKASKGEIPGFKVGGSWRFRKAEIDRLAAGQAPDAEAAKGRRLAALARAVANTGRVTVSASGGRPILDNLLGITDQAEFAREEERISKQQAKSLWDSGAIDTPEVGTFKGLAFIHGHLFGGIFPFAGQLREVNLSKGDFRFAPVLYLRQSLEQIDAMPQAGFGEIVEKYVEMNVAHPFREGNGRSSRVWLDLIFKNGLGMVVDWNRIDKEEYLGAMRRSVTDDTAIKGLLEGALTDRTNDRELFMKGIDASYYYEGYNEYRTEDL